jgi:hypothetical protein
MIEDRHVRVLTDDGEVIRDLMLDPTRDYQPLGTPPGRLRSATMS